MIHWITEHLGTSSWEQAERSLDANLLDVRDLVDKSGNTPAAVKAKIDEALNWLQRGEKVVVCCDYGISRSNAVAAGILATHEKISLDEAVRRVMAATGETAIKIEVLSAVRKAIAENERDKSVSSDARRLLVTGATGFIGRSLMGDLRQRFDVVAPGRQEVDLERDAVSLDLLVRETGVRTLLHLANPRVYTTNESMGAALIMLKNVLDVCVENKLWLIYLSSWEVYSGYKAQELRADETLTPRPGGTYGQTKLLSETLIRHCHQQFGLRYTILRSSPVYGAGSDRPRFIWNFLQKALQGKEIVTHKYLNGFPTLDLLHVDDLCRAILMVLEHSAQGEFNVGSGKVTSTAEVAQMMVARLGSRSTIRQLEIDDYTSNIVMDHGRITAALRWHPIIDVNQGLETILWSPRA